MHREQPERRACCHRCLASHDMSHGPSMNLSLDWRSVLNNWKSDTAPSLQGLVLLYCCLWCCHRFAYTGLRSGCLNLTSGPNIHTQVHRCSGSHSHFSVRYCQILRSHLTALCCLYMSVCINLSMNESCFCFDVWAVLPQVERR